MSLCAFPTPNPHLSSSDTSASSHQPTQTKMFCSENFIAICVSKISQFQFYGVRVNVNRLRFPSFGEFSLSGHVLFANRDLKTHSICCQVVVGKIRFDRCNCLPNTHRGKCGVGDKSVGTTVVVLSFSISKMTSSCVHTNTIKYISSKRIDIKTKKYPRTFPQLTVAWCR